MFTIIAVIINLDVWIKYTISFSVGTLSTHIIKVYLRTMFQILSEIHRENWNSFKTYVEISTFLPKKGKK